MSDYQAYAYSVYEQKLSLHNMDLVGFVNNDEHVSTPFFQLINKVIIMT